MYAGSTSAILNFDAEKALATLTHKRITFTTLVPTTLPRLLARIDLNATTLSADTTFYGGSPPSLMMYAGRSPLPPVN